MQLICAGQKDISCHPTLVGFAIMQQELCLACRPCSTSRLKVTYKEHSGNGCRHASETTVAAFVLSCRYTLRASSIAKAIMSYRCAMPLLVFMQEF